MSAVTKSILTVCHDARYRPDPAASAWAIYDGLVRRFVMAADRTDFLTGPSPAIR